VLRSISLCCVFFSLILLAACTSAPKKPAAPLPTGHGPKNCSTCHLKPVYQCRYRVSNVSTCKIPGARHAVAVAYMKALIFWHHAAARCTAPPKASLPTLRNNNLGGKVVWILGPGGSWHYYAHLDRHKRGLKVGDYVEKRRSHWLCRQ